MTTPQRNTYFEWARTRGPRWLRNVVDGWGERWLRTWGLVLDTVAEATREAVKARLPLRTPADGVPYIGDERGLERYPSETLDAWRDRLGRAWSEWHRAGRPDGLIANFERWGVVAVEVREQGANPVTTETADGDHARFVVVLGDGADPASLPFSPMIMPFTMGDEFPTLGSSATAEQVRQLKTIALKWKSAHGYSHAVVLRFDGGTLPEPLYPRDPDNAINIWRLGRRIQSDEIKTMPFIMGGWNI